MPGRGRGVSGSSFPGTQFILWQGLEEALINLGLTAQGTELPTVGTGRAGGDAHRGRTGLGDHHLLAHAHRVDDFGELDFGLVDILTWLIGACGA